MREVHKIEYVADDGTPFIDKAECEIYEARLPFVTLLRQVEEAVAMDAWFASQIETQGAAVRKARYERGELKRTRASKTEPAQPSASGNMTTTAPSQDANTEWRDALRRIGEGVEEIAETPVEDEAFGFGESDGRTPPALSV